MRFVLFIVTTQRQWHTRQDLSQPGHHQKIVTWRNLFLSHFFDKVIQVTMATGTGALALPGTPGTGARGRRGPAAPTVNTRTIADFDEITAIPFVFARHPMYHEAHIDMNNISSDAFMDMDDLFAVTNPPTRATFVADPVVIIKSKIWNDFIIPNAIDTTDATAITPSWARCSFSICAGNHYSNRRLSLATLRETMQHAITYKMTHELKITIGIQALHFRPGLSYLQWGHDITDSAAGFVAPAAPAAPAVPAATPAPAPGPAPRSSADIAIAVAHAVTTVIAGTPSPSVTVTTPPAPSTTRLRMLFNPSSLPADVRAMFNHKQGRKILTTVIYTPFNCPRDPCHNMHYWIDPPLEKTIGADGTIFFHILIDEKMAMKNPARCRKDTHAAIHRWHQTFQETLMQHGIYVHPLWLFRKNHGGELIN